MSCLLLGFGAGILLWYQYITPVLIVSTFARPFISESLCFNCVLFCEPNWKSSLISELSPFIFIGVTDTFHPVILLFSSYHVCYVIVVVFINMIFFLLFWEFLLIFRKICPTGIVVAFVLTRIKNILTCLFAWLNFHCLCLLVFAFVCLLVLMVIFWLLPIMSSTVIELFLKFPLFSSLLLSFFKLQYSYFVRTFIYSFILFPTFVLNLDLQLNI